MSTEGDTSYAKIPDAPVVERTPPAQLKQGSRMPRLDPAWVSLPLESETEVLIGGIGKVLLNATLQMPTDVTSRRCAVKMVAKDRLDADLSYFLQHDYIVLIYGWYESPVDGAIHIVMEQGLYDLHTVCQNNQLSDEQKAVAFRDICSAVSYLEKCGIVHRDLKPSNIIFCNGRWKLADFGLARHIFDRVYDGRTGRWLLDNGGSRYWTDPRCLSDEDTRHYGLPRSLQCQLDVYSLGRLRRFLFPQDSISAQVEAICLRDELYLRPTARRLYQLSLDPLFDTTAFERWRTRLGSISDELRLRLMQYYHLRFERNMSLSRGDLPFRSVYQRLQIREDGGTNAPTRPQTFEADDLFSHVDTKVRIIVLKGDPGSGKTAFTRHLAREQLGGSLSTDTEVARVVLHVPLRELARMPIAEAIGAWSAESLGRWCLQYDPEHAHIIQLIGRCGWESVLWVLDGYDEVQRTALPFLLRHLKGSHAYGGRSFMHRILLTTRYSADSLPAAPLACVVHLMPWTEGEISQYLEALQEATAPSQPRITVNDVKRLLATNPSGSLQLCPLLADLLVFSALAPREGSVALATIILDVCYRLAARRGDETKSVADSVQEAARSARDYLLLGFIREMKGSSLAKNPILRTHCEGEWAVCEHHHRTIAEVLYALDTLHAGKQKLFARIKEAIDCDDTQIFVDVPVFAMFLAELLADRRVSASLENFTETSEDVMNAMLACPPSRRVAQALTCFLAPLQSSLVDKYFGWMCIRCRAQPHPQKVLMLNFLTESCGAHNNVALLSRLRDTFVDSVSLQKAVSWAHPQRGGAVIQYCSEHGAPPALWQCFEHLTTEGLRARFDDMLAMSADEESAILDVWQALLSADVPLADGFSQPNVKLAVEWLREQHRRHPSLALDFWLDRKNAWWPGGGTNPHFGAEDIATDFSRAMAIALLSHSKGKLSLTVDTQRNVKGVATFAHQALLKGWTLTGVKIFRNGAVFHTAASKVQRFNVQRLAEEVQRPVGEGSAVNLQDSRMDDNTAAAVAEAISSLPHITYLDLRAVHVSVVGRTSIFRAVGHLRRLKHLAVGYNSLKRDESAALAEMLRHNTELEYIDLRDVQMNGDIASAVCAGLHSLRALKCLRFSSNRIGDVGAEALAKAFVESGRVPAELYLEDCAIAAKGVAALVGAFLRARGGWRSIDLSDNPIGTDGVAEIARLLTECEADASSGIRMNWRV